MEIFNATEARPEADELALLIVLVQDYITGHYMLQTLSPLDAFIYKMNEKGIKAKDLEPIIGSKGHVSSILAGLREITLKIAQKLKDYFQLPAELFLPTR
jgi:HTH-type transcriptional regulator/antitoxin HigA